MMMLSGPGRGWWCRRCRPEPEARGGGGLSKGLHVNGFKSARCCGQTLRTIGDGEFTVNALERRQVHTLWEHVGRQIVLGAQFGVNFKWMQLDFLLPDETLEFCFWLPVRVHGGY